MSAEPSLAVLEENERLRAELYRQQRHVWLLREIALASRGVADPTQVFEAIYERLKEVLPVDAFFVALCDHPDSQRYHFALFVDSGVRASFADERVGGLTGWILRLKESRLFRDLHAERTDTVPVPQMFGNMARRSRAWMGVPLMIGRESVGVMSVQSYEYGVYDEADLRLVEALADLAAIAIENAMLYRTQDELGQSLASRVTARSEELAVLTSIASGLSRGQYDEARLMEALERILWMLNLEAGTIWLNDLPSGLRYAAGYEVPGSTVSLGSLHPAGFVEPDIITRMALEQNRPIMRSEVNVFPRPSSPTDLSGTERTISVFAEPLRAHGRVVGTMTLYGEAGRSLEDAEISLLEAASQQMAIGVDNARLYREAREIAAMAEQRADNLALVHRISRLVSSSLDLTEVVRTTVEQMVRLFGVDHCAFMLFDDSGLRGEIVAEYPALGTVGYRAPFIPGDYLEAQPGAGELSFITDLDDRRIRVVRDLAERLGVKASLLVPVISRGRSIGAIGLNLFRDTRQFSDEEKELCRTIAAQVSIAIVNARLYGVTRPRVEQEMEIARSIQANLFPRFLPTIAGAELAGRCLPALETGGDFYDVLPLGGERFGFSIGDVSGKSLPAAMLMAVARSIVRSEAIDHADPERVVTETNRLVVQDVPANTFVSLCYAVYEANSHRLVLANAGHITPFVRHRNGAVEPLTAVSNLPLGIIPDLHYEASAFALRQGDSVLFLTDGLVEAFQPENGAMFGFDRLTDLFGLYGDLPAEEVVDRLLSEVCAWQGSENRNDDMTAIVLQVR